MSTNLIVLAMLQVHVITSVRGRTSGHLTSAYVFRVQVELLSKRLSPLESELWGEYMNTSFLINIFMEELPLVRERK